MSLYTTAIPMFLSSCRRTNLYLSLCTSAVLLHDLKNIGIAVGILLLSWLQAQIYVTSSALPVIGRILWYLTYPELGQYSQKCSHDARPRKLAEIYVICISSFGYKPQSLISHSSRQTTVFKSPWRPSVLTFVPLCCSMQNICGFLWNFTYIPSHSISNVRFKCFRFPVSCPPFWLPVEHASNCTQGDIAIGSGDFGILKNKFSIVEFAFKGDLRPLIQWSPSLSHFHQTIIHTTFASGDVIRQWVGLFRKSQRHSITLWWL